MHSTAARSVYGGTTTTEKGLIMKIRVVLSIDIDPKEWVDLYGLDNAESIRDDVKDYVLYGVQGMTRFGEVDATVALSN
jgi:hypothetical protein